MILLCAFAGKAQATEIVDQAMDLNPAQMLNIKYYSLGQEFTPTLSDLDFVELFIEEVYTGISGQDGSFQVNIREDNINGTILGTSDIIVVPDGTNTGGGDIWTRFTFPGTVSLTPGIVHVIEIEQLSDTGNYMAAGRYNNPYDGGRSIEDGVPQNDFDLCFREGIVPEPTSLALIFVAGLMGLRRRNC